MSENFDEVLSAALSLSPGARAKLADHLLVSLDRENRKRIDKSNSARLKRFEREIEVGARS